MGLGVKLTLEVSPAGNLRESFIAFESAELTEGTTLLVVASGFVAQPAKQCAMVVEGEAPSDHDEPSRESGGSVSPERAQSAEIVLAKPFQNERVTIHDGIVPAAK
ncbi:MAG: hypothetical protein ACREK8_02605 [Gemmatimonadales bacterium]